VSVPSRPRAFDSEAGPGVFPPDAKISSSATRALNRGQVKVPLVLGMGEPGKEAFEHTQRQDLVERSGLLRGDLA